MRNRLKTRTPNKAAIEQPILVERGSGNVFADLDLPNPDLALAKAELVQRIRRLIADRKRTHRRPKATNPREG